MKQPKLGFALLVVFIVGVVVGTGGRVEGQSSTLPPAFAVGQFLQRDQNAIEVLYEVKAVHGEWIRVVTWQKGKPTDEQRWIHAPSGTSWIHSK